MENQVSSADQRALLLERARDASTSPGVYLMKDEGGAVLYVGKAKQLKNRLMSYFQVGPHLIPRTEMMVLRVDRFDVILTETEAEALILECTLIKKYKPKFNVRLKDDKAYPYLRIQMGDPFPRIDWTRRVKKDGARYFGPFPSAWTARQVMRMLNHSFKIRDCSDNTFRHRSRPCILYQIGQCSAPCVAKVTAMDYREQVAEAVKVLEGKGEKLIQGLRRAMVEAAEDEEFERAAEFRDQIQGLEIVTATQVADEAGSGRSRDVIALARAAAEAHGTLLQIRDGKMVSVRHYHVQNTDPSLKDAEILFDFLAQHYLEASKAAEAELNSEDTQSTGPVGPALQMPAEVLMEESPDDPELLERTLGLKIRIPENETERQLVAVAKANARHGLEQAEKSKAGHGFQALEEVAEKLHLPRPPQRIECYDISNTQGEEAVASRVVFIDGAPDKNLYRRYKIRTVVGANDFAMMKEVLDRRFSNVDEALPDLVVVDGGKGQLSQAVAIMEELSVQGVAVVGLAKAKTESDFQATEVKSSLERIFLPNRKNPVPLLPHTQAYKLLTHIRDEAHRFAISYHRLLRSKRSLRSDN